MEDDHESVEATVGECLSLVYSSEYVAVAVISIPCIDLVASGLRYGTNSRIERSATNSLSTFDCHARPHSKKTDTLKIHYIRCTSAQLLTMKDKNCMKNKQIPLDWLLIKPDLSGFSLQNRIGH